MWHRSKVSLLWLISGSSGQVINRLYEGTGET
jgi:hypothetical protein